MGPYFSDIRQTSRYFAMGGIAALAAYFALLHLAPGAPWFVSAHASLYVAAIWVWKNFSFSIPFFLLVAAYFLHALGHLELELAGEAPDSVAVARLEHDIQLSTQLMVGVGVIFTAIGMRGALVHALSDPAAAATEGAFGILQRLVDGGILIALSTTIFGGVAGYVMRVLASFQTAAGLNRFYEEVAQSGQDALLAGLQRIEERLIELRGEHHANAEHDDMTSKGR